MTLPANARHYTELAGLGELRRQARQTPASARADVAREFEAMFVQMMVTRMREAMPATEDDLLGQGGEMYRDLLDKQLSLEIAGAGGIGLARSIERALASRDTALASNAGAADGAERGEKQQLVMPFVPDARARERAAAGALEKVQRSLERLSADPFNGEVMPSPGGREQEGAGRDPVARTRAPHGRHFESPEDFVQSLRGAATEAAAAIGARPDVLLAQAALESGWGRHVMHGDGGRPSHNLFGIKADTRWQGPTVDVITTEYRHGHAVQEKARFRAYASYEESFRDYVAFLRENPRYGKALAVSDQPRQFMQALQQAGYATDPHYASKVVAVMRAGAFDAVPNPAESTR